LDELFLRPFQPFLDLAAALRRARAEPALELLEARRPDEDGDAGRGPLPGDEGALGLQIEERRLAGALNPLDLRPERADPLAPFEVDVLEELGRIDHPLELGLRDEVVLTSLLLARASLARRR